MIIYYLKIFQFIIAILTIIGILLQYTRSDILSNASINKEKETINHDLFEDNISKFIIVCIFLFIGNSILINNLTNQYKRTDLINIKYNTKDKKDDANQIENSQEVKRFKAAEQERNNETQDVQNKVNTPNEVTKDSNETQDVQNKVNTPNEAAKDSNETPNVQNQLKTPDEATKDSNEIQDAANNTKLENKDDKKDGDK